MPSFFVFGEPNETTSKTTQALFKDVGFNCHDATITATNIYS